MRYDIAFTQHAVDDLEAIHTFISEQDSLFRANTFIQQLVTKIDTLATMPYRCRKSFYHENEDHRDLIFKGYTVVFSIDEKHVNVLAVFRQK